jgi:lipoprotein-anchoring transpeptidase ErfK/SrfK
MVVNLPSEVLQPKITASSLEAIKTQTEQMTDKIIVLAYDKFKFTLKQSDLLKWISFENTDGKITPNFNKKSISIYVAGLAKKIDIEPVEKHLSSKDGSVLQEGKDGRALAQIKVISDITSVLNGTFEAVPATADNNVAVASASTTKTDFSLALQVDPKTFATKTVNPPFTPGMYEGKYMEVNLTEQKLYLWDGQNLIKNYRVSSGKKTTPTREGIFKIKNKASVGKSYPWIMPWWMAFAQDRWGAWQGFHELPVDMRTNKKEGIKDIGYAVSHGCVRLAIGDAKEVYDWAEVGIPVYIHK